MLNAGVGVESKMFHLQINVNFYSSVSSYHKTRNYLIYNVKNIFILSLFSL